MFLPSQRIFDLGIFTCCFLKASGPSQSKGMASPLSLPRRSGKDPALSRLQISLTRMILPLLLLLSHSLAAQESALKRHEMFLAYLKETAARISSQSLVQVESPEAWAKQRPMLQRKLLYMLGLDPLPKRTPLHAKITGTLQRTNYRIEKIVFQSLPGLYVTGNFYVPSSSAGPLPTILYVCGHSPDPLGAKSSYQDRAA